MVGRCGTAFGEEAILPPGIHCEFSGGIDVVGKVVVEG